MRRPYILIFFFVLAISAFNSGYAWGSLGDIVSQFNAPGFSPSGLAWDGHFLWHSDPGDQKIYKLDPTNGNILQSFASANINPNGLVFVNSDLWNIDIWNRSYYSVDPTIGPPWTLEFSKPTNDYFQLTFDGTNLWSSDPIAGGDIISKMDLSGNVLQTFPSPGSGPMGLAWDGTYLWNADQITDKIYKLDPSTGNVIASFNTPFSAFGNVPEGLTFDGQYLWMADANTLQIYQLDAGYAAPIGPSPAPPGIVSMFAMLAALGGWAGIRGVVRGRMRRANYSA